MKICLDAGHYGKYNQSPVNKKYYESEMNWKLHLHLKSALEEYGAKVITTRSEQSKDVALVERGKKAQGCDLFLSVHSNAADAESVDYPLACCAVSGKADEIGKKLADTVAEVMETRQHGRIIKRHGNYGDYYGVLRGAAWVGVPGVLLEHSFHTNKRAAEWLLDDGNLKRLAAALAETIANHYGLQKKKQEAVQKPPQNAVQSAQGGFVPYKVKVICEGLNIRKTPVWASGDVVGVIRDKGVYTITAEKMLGTTKFGKLKSGAGWISLGKKYVKKL